MNLFPGGCPDEACDQVSEVVEAYVLDSTDGPIRHVRLLCMIGHRFNMPEVRV